MTGTAAGDGAIVDWRRAGHLVGLVVLLVVVALFLVAAFPQLTGADESYTVLSDSMSPAIEAGAVVFVSELPAERISDGDVITFERPGGALITHRVVAVVERDGTRLFRTKGDANEDPDPELVPASQVVGTVQFQIPHIGYVTSFTQSKLGIFVLVVVPAVLLVATEIWDLVVRARSAGEGEPTRSDETDDQ